MLFFNMIISLLIGIILGIYFKYNLSIYKGPDSNDIKKNIYSIDNKCYKFTPEVCFCSIIR